MKEGKANNMMIVKTIVIVSAIIIGKKRALQILTVSIFSLDKPNFTLRLPSIFLFTWLLVYNQLKLQQSFLMD